MSDIEVNVLVPYPNASGLAVVGLLDLIALLDDGESLADAVTNSAFDSGGTRDYERLVQRVRELNRTGDADAYWAID